MLNYLSHNEKNNVIIFFTDFAKKHNKKIFLDNENIRIEFKYNSNIGFDFTDNKIYAYTFISRKKQKSNFKKIHLDFIKSVNTKFNLSIDIF